MTHQRQQDLLILGTAIRELRAQRGLTASDLAAIADVTPARVTALENGELDPDFELMLALAEGMGIRPSAFFLRAESSMAEALMSRADHVVLQAASRLRSSR